MAQVVKKGIKYRTTKRTATAGKPATQAKQESDMDKEKLRAHLKKLEDLRDDLHDIIIVKADQLEALAGILARIESEILECQQLTQLEPV